MRVAIYSRKVTKNASVNTMQILKFVQEFGWEIVLESNFKAQLIIHYPEFLVCDTFSSYRDFTTGIDLAISIGGDGTFLQTVGFVRDTGVPVMGINTGRLGFLANINQEQVHRAFELVQEKKYVFQQRSLLKVETESGIFGNDNFALNELTVNKKDTSSMITVHAKVDGNFLNSYWADGLIVSTPTGSTAYSLSCGGPIVSPGCQVHILTPIAPHNLNVRPMIVPDHMPIELYVEGRERKYLVSIDSNSKHIKKGEKIFVEKANFMVNVIKFEDHTFLDTIRNKMLWGLDIRN